MIDFAKITAIAGNGGRGAGSFMHTKGKRLGKADGGDGGRGGHVYLMATTDLNTLEPFRFIKEYRARDGQQGSSQRRKGAEGEDLIVKVPVGTLIKIENLKLKIENFYDLVQDGQKVLVARGGQEGRGNVHLRDEFGRRPKSGEAGETGETVNLTLELKLIADVGLIGLPNAGKSTLLRALTSATPKVAPYPFTTLEPNLGVMSAPSVQRLASSKKEKDIDANSLNAKRSIVIADIPGLIEGASQGRGLGDLFLRHIERTKILVHLIDVSCPDDLWEVYQTVRSELKQYSKDLSKKREIIVLNKIDLIDKNSLDENISKFKARRKKVIAISAQNSVNLAELCNSLLLLTR